jgi:hypothetical protein
MKENDMVGVCICGLVVIAMMVNGKMMNEMAE